MGRATGLRRLAPSAHVELYGTTAEAEVLSGPRSSSMNGWGHIVYRLPYINHDMYTAHNLPCKGFRTPFSGCFALLGSYDRH